MNGESVKRLPRGELLRKLVHMAVGLVAFAVRFLGPWWAAACAAAATLSNLFLLPRIGGKRLWREGETARGFAHGIVLYPLTVCLLLLLFWQRFEVAAATWAILAFGDGMASLVGMTMGRRKLPWNPRKSWAGSLAYAGFGTAGSATLLLWTTAATERTYTLAFALGISAAAALFAALLESLPQGLDDNLGVPLLTGLFLYGLTFTAEFWQEPLDERFLARLAIGVAVNLVLALAGFATRSVDVSGALAGFAVGTVIWACLDWRGYLLLLAFFVLGTAATKLGYQRKAKEGLAQEAGGRRGARHALANTAVAVGCAFFAVTTPFGAPLGLAFAAAFATKTSDTAASEIGQLYGRRTFLITSLRPVPRGTEGAVSLEGTLAGLFASALVAALGAAVGFYGGAGVLIVIAAAFAGTTLESLVGATLERRGLLDNEAVNFLATLAGALIALGLDALIR